MSARRGGRLEARGARGPKSPGHRAEGEYTPPPEHRVLTWEEETKLEERFRAGLREPLPEPQPDSYADYLVEELERAYQAERRERLQLEILREREKKEEEREMARATDNWLLRTGQASQEKLEGAVGGGVNPPHHHPNPAERMREKLRAAAAERRRDTEKSLAGPGITVETSAMKIVKREKEEGEIESDSEEKRENARVEEELEDLLRRGDRRKRVEDMIPGILPVENWRDREKEERKREPQALKDPQGRSSSRHRRRSPNPRR